MAILVIYRSATHPSSILVFVSACIAIDLQVQKYTRWPLESLESRAYAFEAFCVV